MINNIKNFISEIRLWIWATATLIGLMSLISSHMANYGLPIAIIVGLIAFILTTIGLLLFKKLLDALRPKEPGELDNFINELEKSVKVNRKVLPIHRVVHIWMDADNATEYGYQEREGRLISAARAKKIGVDKIRGRVINAETKIFLEDIINIAKSKDL